MATRQEKGIEIGSCYKGLNTLKNSTLYVTFDIKVLQIERRSIFPDLKGKYSMLSGMKFEILEILDK